MASTLTNLLFHVVFSTKARQNLLSPEICASLYPYIGGVIRGEKGRLITAGGRPDHIHIFATLAPSISLSDMLRRVKVKGNSSHWLNEQHKMEGRFSWQRGYGAFTVSESSAAGVITYIEGQEEHHKRMTFQEEFLLLLKKHNVHYDERYIWE